MAEKIEIDKAEYDRLVDVDRFMDALDAAGVDNWEGYGTAYQIYDGEIDEDDI